MAGCPLSSPPDGDIPGHILTAILSPRGTLSTERVEETLEHPASLQSYLSCYLCCTKLPLMVKKKGPLPHLGIFGRMTGLILEENLI